MLTNIYRGVVVDPVDPSGLNRLRVSIPLVTGTDSMWALPCLTNPSIPVPKVAQGQGVWVMFEGGDRAYPVWVGFYGTRGPAELPPVEQGGVADHGDLTGLNDDDHRQYPLMWSQADEPPSPDSQYRSALWWDVDEEPEPGASGPGGYAPDPSAAPDGAHLAVQDGEYIFVEGGGTTANVVYSVAPPPNPTHGMIWIERKN